MPELTPAQLKTLAAQRASMDRARRAHMAKSADRAVDDPRQLARAARIVRRALERKVLTPADVLRRESGSAA